MRSKIAANLNVLEFVKIFGDICKTLGVRWSNRYGVTAPLAGISFRMYDIVLIFACTILVAENYHTHGV